MQIAENLKPPSEWEQQRIDDELSKLQATLPQSYVLLVHHMAYREVLAFPTEQLADIALTISKTHNIYFGGIFAGSFRGDKFRLALDLADHLYRGGRLKRTFTLQGKAVESFLYGRNVAPCQGEGIMLIVDRKGEVLGLGECRRGILKNLIDKGWYIRRGG
jgi:ribosome biogenesis protein Nip4